MKTGTRLVSVACDTEVMVVRSADVDLHCGGHLMVDAVGERSAAEPSSEFAGGTLLGKRYAHAGSGLQVLCVKAGQGTLSVNGVALSILESKQLPSSD
ncbi:hypothetical protein [Nocardioides sp. YIM 152315]|uniref:hypothetical protein n=1 Tax=Nocardioides sp. YIM 152315 TaxID=3031760 RepID=UPI0023DC6733|nr:hypothetical protein [Nocardioides sp. YIM 152315]MDF1602245.1 hypothetical protein [Nocardioides sp. YIM 152315]